MFFSLVKTSDCFPTFLLILATCLLKFSELSIVTPKRSKWSTIVTCTSLTLKEISLRELFGRIIHLHFSGPSTSLLSSNQRLATARSPSITDFTTSGSRSLTKNLVIIGVVGQISTINKIEQIVKKNIKKGGALKPIPRLHPWRKQQPPK